MDMTGSRTIAADQQAVWQALLDPEVLKACVPGCQELTGTVEEGFTATVIQKVGPVKATFKGTVTFPTMSTPDSLTLTGEGKGGAAGFAKGSADVKLSTAPEGTQLDYDVEAKVGGKLAQLGSRIIDGFARKMADQFFEKFQEAVEGPTAAATEADAPSSAPVAEPAAAAAPAMESEPASAAAPEPAKKSWWKRLFGG